MRTYSDPFGQALLDYYNSNVENVKQEGWMTTCQRYFNELEWFDREKKAIQLAHGRILGIGCSVGRHTFHLQELGYTVTGIDTSPISINLAKHRGVKDARVLSITQLNYKVGMFDIIIMFGNNFALVGTVKRAKWLCTVEFCQLLDGTGLQIQETIKDSTEASIAVLSKK